jgi:ATP-dependent Lon protease
LATPFDLSKIVFVATANSLDTIHPALIDRMEIIDISGYSLQEKLQIGQRYLLPRQISENGIKPEIISLDQKILE